MVEIANELGYIFAFGVAVAFFILLIYFGMPQDYSIVGAYDIAIMGFGLITTGVGCTLLMGVGCAVAGSISALGMVGSYIAAGALTPTLSSIAFLKAVILTPVMLGVAYIIAKLARGGG